MAGGVSRAGIEAWLVSALAERAGLSPADIDVDQPFERYGIDSAAAVSIAGDLERWLGRPLPETLAYDYPTIALVAAHLGEGTGAGRAPAAGPAPPRPRLEPIAITGAGCRFPQADGPAAFWRLLSEGVDAIGEVPADRWDAESLYDPEPGAAGKTVTRFGGFVADVDRFDPLFFGISPREAAHMDPQQRLLLEVTWEALASAGLPPSSLAGTRTGVFVGLSTADYAHRLFARRELLDGHTITGNSPSIASNRLSYLLDLRGPSMTVDTACSSSLVAVQLACQSLWTGEADTAIAGGANVILNPEPTIGFSRFGALAPDGRCKAFDARADGFVRGEGAGVVVLRPLSVARAAGDPVHAIIRGGAVNNDGRTNGLTAPSRQAQEAVLRDAHARAGVRARDIRYVEAHGTGTRLGDPIEAGALGAVLAPGRALDETCAIGSVKTNIGHLEAAAGIASLIKVTLAMKHRALPPSLHFQDPNPLIPFQSMPIEVQRELGAWPEGEGPALAGVSSSGFGGTNAHLVVEEAPESDRFELEPIG